MDIEVDLISANVGSDSRFNRNSTSANGRNSVGKDTVACFFSAHVKTFASHIDGHTIQGASGFLLEHKVAQEFNRN